MKDFLFNCAFDVNIKTTQIRDSINFIDFKKNLASYRFFKLIKINKCKLIHKD